MQQSRFRLERARFDPFVWHDDTGNARFSGRQQPTKGRHRDRVWPALSRYKRVRRKTGSWCDRAGPATWMKMTRSIDKAALLTVLRRWDPMSSLEAWHIKQCDHAQRPPRYDPW